MQGCTTDLLSERVTGLRSTCDGHGALVSA